MKYKLLTDDTIKSPTGATLYRIRACRGVRPDVPEGTLGGYVQNHDNLSPAGSSWIYDGAQVYGGAAVHGDALVYGDVKVYGRAEVYGDAKVYGRAEVLSNARVHGDAKVYGSALVHGDAKVYGSALVHGDAVIYGSALVHGDAVIYGYARVHGNAIVLGNAVVCGNAELCGSAEVRSSQDYMVFKNSWSSYRWFTYTASNRQWKVGCFLGFGEALIKKAYANSERSGRCYETIVRAVEAIDAVTRRQASSSSGMDL